MKTIISSKSTKTVAVDFDGVLHEYIEWDGPKPKNKPIEGALDFINELYKKYEVVIFSCRASTQAGIDGIKQWLKDHDFPSLKIVHKKPEAILYVDDRGYRFDNNFDEILKFIDKLN